MSVRRHASLKTLTVSQKQRAKSTRSRFVVRIEFHTQAGYFFLQNSKTNSPLTLVLSHLPKYSGDFSQNVATRNLRVKCSVLEGSPEIDFQPNYPSGKCA